MIANLLGGYCGGRFGPKRTILASYLPSALSWVVIGLSPHCTVLYCTVLYCTGLSPHFVPLILGRTLSGLSDGLTVTNCPLLVAQYRSVACTGLYRSVACTGLNISLHFFTDL